MKTLYIFTVLSFISGCSTLENMITPAEKSPQLIALSEQEKLLHSMPPPIRRIPVAVYSFRDQTGQYKPKDNVSSFSTAVTQGATSILIQSLSDSNWFIAVERESLQNILTERKIVRAGKAHKDKGKDLPSLTPARIILEGGIISYDSNIKTGGAGAEYFGIGGSTNYREDQISIYMRAIDINTGRILLSVATSKTVFSYQIRAGFFQYVSYKRLMELEGGYSNNEPMHISVKTSIEHALIQLINKGIKKGIWSAKKSKPT